MSKKLPVISHKIKIHVICEGDEEIEYLNSLKELGVWSDKYEVTFKNANGNGNIFPFYQDAFQMDNYDLIFAFVDTDKCPYSTYKNIKLKINDIYGNDNATDFLLLFGNPCTMQIVILHFGYILLESHLKRKNKDIIYKCTGVESYNATEAKRKALFSLISVDNYELMKKGLAKLSKNDEEKNSSNFLAFLNNLENDNIKWIEDLQTKLDI